MTTETQEAPAQRGVVVGQPISGDVVAVFESMAEAIPLAEGNGYDGILEAIAGATSAADLDAPWRSTGLGKLVGVPIMVQSITRQESTFADSPLGFFLIIRGGTLPDGEPFVATTGSVGVVGQLVKAYHLGALPLRCRVISKESRSNPGTFVQHLEILP